MLKCVLVSKRCSYLHWRTYHNVLLQFRHVLGDDAEHADQRLTETAGDQIVQHLLHWLVHHGLERSDQQSHRQDGRQFQGK